MTLEQTLASFRENEAEADLAMIVDDPIVVRFLTAFQAFPVSWKRPKAKAPTDPHRLWLWLWQGVTWDLESVCKASRLPEAAVRAYAQACMACKAIYPDGTLSGPVQEFIAAFTRQRYPGRKRGRPTGAKDQSKRAGDNESDRADYNREYRAQRKEEDE